MKKENASRIVSMIDGKYVDEATEFAINKKHETQDRHASAAKQSHRFGWRAAAACIALAAVIGSAAFACAVEAKNYNTAAGFFEEYGLSTEGLSRAEVKAVYRDITEKRFSYGKTADVIRQAVPGWEIEQADPTPEELAAIWDKNVWAKPISEKGVSFRIDPQYVFDPQKGFEVLDKCVLECYTDGKMTWSAEFTDFYIEDYAYTKEGTVLWGQSEIFSSSDTTYGWIALVDGEGNVMWQKRLEHGFKNEYVGAILRNEDGTWAVVSRGDLKYLCLSCYSADGKELSFRKTEVGNLGIWNAARLGDGYIVQLGNLTSRDTALLYRMDREGRVTDSFSYEAEDCEYHITDLTEFEGQVYLSAYAVPLQNDEGGRHEIANVLDYISSKEGGEISSEELTPLVRENYTAVLLLCDPEGGEPKTFRSVEGSLGGRLSVNDAGRLEWDVESVTSTFFSPATSSFTVGGICKVFRYTFDAEGTLIGQTDTGETVPYRR
ncbi:MAG: hypothetical protein IJR51_10210 [Clostridia bacterium]|nr:hypothetical protein [Clostridia bacterium]